MALPDFTMRELLEAGVHFGHQKHYWNPKMQKLIFGERGGVHILDLSQTVPMLHRALKVISDTVGQGGRVLFVGTKRQATDLVADCANKSAQYYVNSRWLGGTLTNWKTISNSIGRLRVLEAAEQSGENMALTKKERLIRERELANLVKGLGGIKDMGGAPDLMVIIDTNRETIAIKEAVRLQIPIVAVVDSNANPDNIDYPIPGNDDATRAIALYCDLFSKAAIDGIGRSQTDSGVDIGASEEPTQEALPVVDSADEISAPYEVLTAPRGTPDALSELNGVSHELENTLNELGIFHFSQLAGLDEAGIAHLDQLLPVKGRIVADQWVEQAKARAEAEGSVAADVPSGDGDKDAGKA